MPDRRPPKSEHIVIIGAGLTGLAAAHRLVDQAREDHRPLDVTVLEARDRVGGAIWTDYRDGFTLEGGADSFITNKPQGLELCQALGLGEQLIETDARFRRSFVVRRGRLLPVPEGFVLMAPKRLRPLLTSPILSWRGKLRLLLDLVIPRRLEESDESLASFVRRRLGREALDRLVQPLVGGIYTADPNELSLQATLPQFRAMEREYGSLIRAALEQSRSERQADRQASGARYGLFTSLAEGMGTLPKTLAKALPRGTIRLETTVRRLVREQSTGGNGSDSSRPWRIERLDGPPLIADAVILAVEGHASARLVDGFDPDLSLQLRSIPYASSAIVNIAFRREQVAHPLDGFGAVVPIVEGRQILAISFTSVKFPSRAPDGTVLMRVFVGGSTQPELFERDDDEIRQLVRRELSELLGTSGEPIFDEVARHPRGMPQYTLGHLDRVAKIRQAAEKHPRLILAGNAFTGVGIPDCIRSGQEAAETAFQELASASRVAVA